MGFQVYDFPGHPLQLLVNTLGPARRYYSRLYVENNLSLDGSLVKEYFPVSFLVPAILDIYQNLLGVKFVEVSGEAKDVWHPGESSLHPHYMSHRCLCRCSTVCGLGKRCTRRVRFHRALLLRSLPSWYVGNRVIRYCNCLAALLMFNFSEAKFPHAAVFCLLPGYELSNGKRHYPVAAIVTSLAKPTPERPALMGHFDVTILFHEMGHIFHELLSRTRYSRFHGTTVALDFAEAPSQMLENWSALFLSL